MKELTLTEFSFLVTCLLAIKSSETVVLCTKEVENQLTKILKQEKNLGKSLNGHVVNHLQKSRLKFFNSTPIMLTKSSYNLFLIHNSLDKNYVEQVKCKDIGEKVLFSEIFIKS